MGQKLRSCLQVYYCIKQGGKGVDTFIKGLLRLLRWRGGIDQGGGHKRETLASDIKLNIVGSESIAFSLDYLFDFKLKF